MQASHPIPVRQMSRNREHLGSSLEARELCALPSPDGRIASGLLNPRPPSLTSWQSCSTAAAIRHSGRRSRKGRELTTHRHTRRAATSRSCRSSSPGSEWSPGRPGDPPSIGRGSGWEPKALASPLIYGLDDATRPAGRHPNGPLFNPIAVWASLSWPPSATASSSSSRSVMRSAPP